MPILRNSKTGAVVSCSEHTAALLGGEWVPADAVEAPVDKVVVPDVTEVASEEVTVPETVFEAEEVPEEKPAARGKATTK